MECGKLGARRRCLQEAKKVLFDGIKQILPENKEQERRKAGPSLA